HLIRYLINKIAYATLTLFGVVSVIFFLFNVLPGDPARMMLDQNENSEQLAAIKKKFGFDLPIRQQYIYYLNDLSPLSIHSKSTDHFTYYTNEKYGGKTLFETQNKFIIIKKPYLRESFQKNGKKVSTIIAETLPNTIFLAVFAIGIAIGIGIFLGIISALY